MTQKKAFLYLSSVLLQTGRCHQPTLSLPEQSTFFGASSYQHSWSCSSPKVHFRIQMPRNYILIQIPNMPKRTLKRPFENHKSKCLQSGGGRKNSYQKSGIFFLRFSPQGWFMLSNNTILFLSVLGVCFWWFFNVPLRRLPLSLFSDIHKNSAHYSSVLFILLQGLWNQTVQIFLQLIYLLWAKKTCTSTHSLTGFLSTFYVWSCSYCWCLGHSNSTIATSTTSWRMTIWTRITKMKSVAGTMVQGRNFLSQINFCVSEKLAA